MTKSKIALFLIGFTGILASLQYVTAGTADALAPLPLNAPENQKRVALGERLFHDQRLSDQGKRSCATCHPLDLGAMDGLPRAEAIDGHSVLRNTPSLFNVSFNFFYNWDGVVTTLEAHTERVMLNPKIMKATWPSLIAGLGADPTYRRDFISAYPDGLNQKNLVDAMVSFERSLITPNSRFDQFISGKKNALDEDEQRGYELFISLGCIACHQGINIGGNLFQKFGVFGAPKGGSKVPDEGRYTVTKNPRDRGVYRVPSLRNVAITAPYFHDGRAATLEAAVDTMSQNQLGKPLDSNERSLIIKFLKTLTGEYRGKPVSRDKTEDK
jgi:cytochrome c peroxidase